MENEITYLGDGLYVNYDGIHVEVYSYNGVTATNKVYFDSETLGNFLAFVERLKKK